MKQSIYKERISYKDSIIITINGKSFGSFTKGFKKPFDDIIIDALKHTASKLCEEIQNVKFVYGYSDEIVLVLSGKQHWYNGSIQDIASASASIATYHFNDYMDRKHWFPRIIEDPKNNERRPAHFVSNVEASPTENVAKKLVELQRAAINDSVKSFALSVFDKKATMNKNLEILKGMLETKGINWDTEISCKKIGFTCYKESYSVEPTSTLDTGRRTRWKIDGNIPAFAEDKTYIEKHLTTT